MRKVLIALFIGSLFSGIGSAQQEKVIRGKVLDKRTKEPVPGVYLFYRDQFLAFTDSIGVFMIPDSCYKADKQIVLRHVSFYDTDLPFRKKHKDTIIVFLKSKTYNIGEVIVAGEQLKSVLKKARKQYQEDYLPGCYWARSDYSQLMQYNNRNVSFFESDGFVYLRRPTKIGFGGEPNLIPLELRRTKEDALPGLKEIDSTYNYITIWNTYSVLLGFSFLETIHPLEKYYENKYSFSYDSLSDKDYFLINFKQKKKITISSGWTVRDMRGQMKIDRSTYEIKKIICYFHTGWQTNQLTVLYDQKNNVLFPKRIKISQLRHYQINGRSNELYSYALLETDGMIKRTQNCYSEAYYFLLGTILNKYDYHPGYWDGHILKDPFMESGLQDLLSKGIGWDDSKSVVFRREPPQIIYDKSEKMLEHLKNDSGLTNL